MRIALQSPVRKAALVGISSLVAALYVALAAAQYLSSYFAEKPDLVSLQRAIRLQPGSAEYYYRLGRYLSLVQLSPEQALQPYRTAVALNPFSARYWFDLASTYQVLGDADSQRVALESAIQADPRTPDVAWQAANFYIVQGQNDRALQEFRVVLENDPSMAPAALPLALRMSPDVATVLRDAMPPTPQSYYALLDILATRKDSAGAALAWAQLAALHQPLERRRVFDYVRYLIGQKEVDQAELVWKQAANLCDLGAYQPSPSNLVVNGDFSLDVLNGGFDWLYHKSPEVTLALDPTQYHTGHRSLHIVFDSRGLEDAGIRQVIPVQPNTPYQFSANFKAQDLKGVGGPRFAIQDLYDETLFYASDELKDADFWKPVSGAFVTGPNTRLVVLRIQRFPAGNSIKGKLWIDGVRLAQQ